MKAIKILKNTLLVKLGIASRRREEGRTSRILFYHGVSNVSNTFVEGLHITPDAFRKQLIYIRNYHDPISLDEFYKRWNELTLSGKEVVLTFDDGYKNNLTIAAPLLHEFGFPFTVFISTKHIDNGNRFATFIGRAIVMHPPLSVIDIPAIGFKQTLSSNFQRKKVFKKLSYQLKHVDISTVNKVTEQLIGHLTNEEYQTLCKRYTADAPMTWEEVSALQRDYDCTIGSHCLDHFICDSFQQEAEVVRQLSESKNVIEQKLGTPCHYLAYPNGNAHSIAIDAAGKAGYRMAFTTENRRMDYQLNPLAMPRYGVNFNLKTFITDMAIGPK